jgi:DnaK suppressor protein
MAKKEGAPRKSARKALVSGVVSAAKTAKASAKAVLITGRTLPPPVEIEPVRPNAAALGALHRERQRLLDELKRQEIVEQEHPTTGNHMADDATEVSEQAKTLALRRHLEGMVKEIDRAIVRAERGLYGVCERCGRPISEERLRVVPSASFCIDCAKLQVRNLRIAA